RGRAPPAGRGSGAVAGRKAGPVMMWVWSVLAAGVVLVVLFATWVFYGIRQIGQVSRGALIPTRQGQALILIDLQEVFWDGPAYTEADKSRAEAAILDAVRDAKAGGVPIVALRQEWSLPATRLVARLFMQGQALAGSPGTGLAKPFLSLADYEVVKRVQDGFETGELDTLLGRLDVGALRLAGLDFDYCIARTAEVARQRGYSVGLVPGGALQAAKDTGKTRERLIAAGVTGL
ncbi:MAG: isochorismatase family protein, partial [Pseudomonadota bacterium]